MISKVKLDSKFYPDKRICNRANTIVEAMCNNPNVTIPCISDAKGFTKAMYRFLESKHFTHECILNSYVQSTVSKLPKAEMILIAQDTSDLDYTNHIKTTGLGYLDNGSKKLKNGIGLKFHSALAISPSGEIYGLIDQKIYSRSGKTSKEKNARKSFGNRNL